MTNGIRSRPTAEHANAAITTENAAHGRDRLGKDFDGLPFSSPLLTNTIQRAFAHDHNVCASHKLQMQRMGEFSDLQHAFASRKDGLIKGIFKSTVETVKQSLK